MKLVKLVFGLFLSCRALCPPSLLDCIFISNEHTGLIHLHKGVLRVYQGENKTEFPISIVPNQKTDWQRGGED